ncbi:hypothetical protein [Streptomyces prunicolor]|uniref:hypothetical protein n=1 Tax=Streptomyces prunicolor TaxID=67348 RepID=UPI0034247885
MPLRVMAMVMLIGHDPQRVPELPVGADPFDAGGRRLRPARDRLRATGYGL